MIPPLLRGARGRVFPAALTLLLFTGCLSYEKSQTRVTIDRKTGIARVQVTYWNLASTETAREGQSADFEQLDSLRRSDAYFLSSYLRSANAGKASKRKVWIEKGQMHASYTVQVRDLNQIAEGWSADTAGYRYVSMLEISKTNGQRTTDEKPTVRWPRQAAELIVGERDPHIGESVPFLPEFRDSLNARLKREAPSKTTATAKKKTPKNTSKRSTH